MSEKIRKKKTDKEGFVVRTVPDRPGEAVLEDAYAILAEEVVRRIQEKVREEKGDSGR